MSEATERATDRRGFAVLGWLLALCLASYTFVQGSGLKYEQRISWPTDLRTFRLATGPAPEVVVLGSSKASFDLSPTALRACGAGRTVNLARVYATAFTAHALARDLLTGPKRPRVVLLAMEPETVNDFNHQLQLNVPFHADLGDLPDVLASVHSWSQLVAAARIVVRGPENLAAFVSRASDPEPRLSWLMTWAGGGQWCFGFRACERQNAMFLRSESDRWDVRVREWLPVLRSERFTRYDPEHGVSHDGLVRLADWAEQNDVELVLLNMPVHALFQAEIPEEVYARYRTFLENFARSRGLRMWDGNIPEFTTDRAIFLDPDHLNPTGAALFADRVCAELLAPAM